MSEFTTFLDVDANTVFSQVVDAHAFHALPRFSIELAHEELQRMIVETGAYEDSSRIYEQSENCHRLRELEVECAYINKECRITSGMHFVGPSDDYEPDVNLRPVLGTVIATPQCFTFINSPMDGQVTPCLLSLTQVYSPDSDESEVVELFTPVDSCHINLHTPAFN